MSILRIVPYALSLPFVGLYSYLICSDPCKDRRIPGETLAPPSAMGSSGLEPPTSRLSGARSNQLSYEPVFAVRLWVPVHPFPHPVQPVDAVPCPRRFQTVPRTVRMRLRRTTPFRIPRVEIRTH